MSEELEGETPVYDDLEGTPDEIRDFLVSNNIGKKYQCMIKEVIPGGKPGVLETFNNTHPEVDEIGKRWGPGDYLIVFSWIEGVPGGGRQKKMKELNLAFPERAWRSIHEDFLGERSRERKKQKERELETAKQDAEIEAARKGFGKGNVDPVAALKDALATAKSLGIEMGGSKLDLQGIAAMVTAVVPLLKALGVVGGEKGGDSMSQVVQAMQAQNALLLKAILDARPGGGGSDPMALQMNKILDMTMGAMGKAMEFQDMLRPQEKESLVDKIYGLVEKFLPSVLELAKVSKQEREKNLIYQIASGSSEIEKARKYPDVALALVEKWDKFYGFQTTNQILEVAGIPRPPETAKNLAIYPSEGFGPDGKAVETASADVLEAEDAGTAKEAEAA